MLRRPLPWKPLLCCALIVLTAPALSAQETIKWRTDYNAARKEAEARNVPVFIDMYKDACPPCITMENTTFKDPRIVSILNEKFIPLKVNGPVEGQLAGRLQISAYPTLVLAAPDGRITNTLIGLQDTSALLEHLQRLLTSLAPPDVVGEKDLQDAIKFEANGEYSRAIHLLRGLLDDPKDRAVKKDAKVLLAKIEKRAEDRLTQARELHTQGKSVDALETLGDILRVYPGLTATKDASELHFKIVQSNRDLQVAQRGKRARELLAQARDFYASKDYIPCVDRCELIVATFGDLPEGPQAFALASEIKNNPEWMRAAKAVMIDRLAGIMLATAEGHLKRSEIALARTELESVIRMFPGTRMAESAQIRLTQLQSVVPERKDMQTVRP